MFGKISLFDKSKNQSAPIQDKASIQQNSFINNSKPSHFNAIGKNKKIKKASKDDLQKKHDDLQGAKFRLLNEMLYTN